MATLTVLAMGKGVLPLMLTVSPVLRSSAAMPTSADLPATSELSCCSRLKRLGDEAADRGCAANARIDRKSAMNRIYPYPRAAALTPESSPNAHIRSKL